MPVKDNNTPEDEGEWEFLGVGETVPNRRSVVSVSLNAKDFASVSTCARQHNMKTSEFLRWASLDKAKETNVSLTSIQGTFAVSYLGVMTLMSPTSGTSSGPKDLEEDETGNNRLVVSKVESWAI